MAFASGYDLAEAVLTMTLCANAYLDQSPLPNESAAAHVARMRRDIDAALAGGGYADWRVIWGPGLNTDGANMLYVAGNRAANQYAVTIRGTEWQFCLDWIEDFTSLLGLVPFRFLLNPPPSADVRVAAGLALTLQQLLAIVATDGQQATGLLSFLEALPPDASIFVTGHSQGGGVASLLAVWLAWSFGSAARLKVYTFAAPSPGNAGFARYYNALFRDATGGASTAYRVYNTLDVVPHAWASLAAIASYYQPAPAATPEIRSLATFAQAAFAHDYAQVGTANDGSAVPLTGTVVPPPQAFGLNIPADAQFAWEAEYQHGTATYLHLLAAPAPTIGPKLRRLASRLPASGGTP